MLHARRWRGLTVLSAIVIAFGACMIVLGVFDLDIFVHAFTGLPYDMSWEHLERRIRPGLTVMLGGSACLVLSGAMWGLSLYVALNGGPYWLRMRRQAAARLRARGHTDPSERDVCREVLFLEGQHNGWHPETVLRFVEASTQESDRTDSGILDELHDWSVQLRVACDEALRSGGAVHPIEVSGEHYDADQLATLTEKVDLLVRDLRFRDSGRPIDWG